MNGIDRERIWTEELLRFEIREQIEQIKAPKSRYQKLSNFLNSSIGIWIMTNLVIVVVAFVAGNIIEKFNKSQENTAQITKLDIEISRRLSLLDQGIKSVTQNNDAIIIIDKFNSDFGIYPEFQGRDFYNLLFELSQRTSDNDVKNLLTVPDDIIRCRGEMEKAAGATFDGDQKKKLLTYLKMLSIRKWRAS